MAVLLILLGSWRGGLIVATAIPLSMLVAFTGMVQANISGNLMSLGAIDFGLIVDGAVVMVENIIRYLGQHRNGDSVMDTIRAAAQEVARPIFFAVTIIVLVYVPILTLGGVEGKMFRPMAATVAFCFNRVANSRADPNARSELVCLPERYWGKRNLADAAPACRSMSQCLRSRSTTRFSFRPLPLVAFALSVFGASKLGAEFIPQLDEGSILVMMYRLPGISIDESLHGNEIIEKVLREFPEVRDVFSRTGRPRSRLTRWHWIKVMCTSR